MRTALYVFLICVLAAGAAYAADESVPLPKAQAAESNGTKRAALLKFYYLKEVSRNFSKSDWIIQFPSSNETGYVFIKPRSMTIDSIKQPQEVLDKVVNVQHNPPILTGVDVKNAQVEKRPGVDGADVNLALTGYGTKVFADFTRRHIGGCLAIFYDGRLLMAPWINEAIQNGRVEITGFKTLQDAQNLANKINVTDVHSNSGGCGCGCTCGCGPQ